MVTPRESNEQRRSRLLDEFDRLAAFDFPLFPVCASKVPKGQWALGEVNYVLNRMGYDEATRRVDDPRVVGWAILCGNPSIKVFTLDVERAGMVCAEIREVLARIPDCAKRPSPSGGMHAVLVITDGDAIPTEALARVDGVLLAEVRGVGSRLGSNGAYAVITGPGRGPLDPWFEPMYVTSEQAQAILDPIRALHQPTALELTIATNKTMREYGGSGLRSGTGGCISQAVEAGELGWLDLLDEGWSVVALADRTDLLRPSYGLNDQPKSGVSANVLNNVLVVHSSAVPWADPCEFFNPPQAYAAAHFEADFAAAMAAVERAATEWVETEQAPSGIFTNWPTSLLEEIYHARRTVQREYMAAKDSLESEPGRACFRILGRDDLRALPQPEPLIDRTLDRNTVALLAGPPSSYKSFVALDWACSIATGTPWQGRGTVSGRVVLIAAEGAYGLNQRVSAWEEHHRIAVPNDRLTIVSHAVQLHRPNELDELIDAVRSEPTAMVILDTLARCAVGLDENSAKDMGVIVHAATHLRNHTDRGTVVLIHHTGKNGTTIRGSSALEGGVDTVYAARAQSKPHLILERRKRKDGPEADVVHLEAVQPSFSDSLVLLFNGMPKITGNQAIIVSNLQSNSSGEPVTARDLQVATGLGKSSVNHAVKALVNMGVLLQDSACSPLRYSLAVAV
jgi:hypothetical protein